LLKVALEVVEGKNEESQLQQMLQERRLGLKQSRDDFVQRMDYELQKNPDFAPEFAVVEQSLNNYEAALDEMQKYFLQKDISHLKYGVPSLIDATNKLLLAMSNLDAKYYYSGPSPFPHINLLRRLMENFKSNPSIAKDILFNLQNLEQMFRRLLNNIDNLPDPKLRSKKLIEAAYREILDCLTEMKISVEKGETENLPNGLIRLENAQQKINDAFSEHRHELYFEHPTKSPLVNLLINAINGTRQGCFSPDILPTTAEILEKDYREVKNEFSGAMGIAETDLTLQQPFSLMEDALALIRQYQTETNPELLNKSEALLMEAADEFWKLSKFAGEVSEIFCINCGKLNPPNQKACIQCENPFPFPDEDINSSTFQISEGQATGIVVNGVAITENFKTILETVDKMYRDELSLNEFETTLNWMEQLLLQASHEVKKVPTINPEKYPQAKDQAENAKQQVDATKILLTCGLETARQGIDTMRNYLKDENKEYLVEGLKEFWQGAREITQIKQLSRNMTYTPEASEED